MTSILKYISSLYTVYTNLFIYDSSCTIVALSDQMQNSLLGHKLSGDVYTKTLANTDSQTYFVSNFVTTPLYDNKKTYIYNASISNFENKNVGGIGIVFDSAPQFEAILDEVLNSSSQTGLFCEKDGTIIATSSQNPLKIGEIFEPILTYIKNKETDHGTIFEINDKKYFIGMAKSQGYREYKKEDNYRNDVYCAILAQI